MSETFPNDIGIFEILENIIVKFLFNFTDQGLNLIF